MGHGGPITHSHTLVGSLLARGDPLTGLPWLMLPRQVPLGLGVWF